MSKLKTLHKQREQNLETLKEFDVGPQTRHLKTLIATITNMIKLSKNSKSKDMVQK